MNMRTAIAIVFPVLLLSGCERDPDAFGAGTLRLTIVPTWAGGEFTPEDTYVDVRDHRVQVQLLKMYLGEFTAMGPEGATLLKDIDLVELTDGPVSREWSLEPGTYGGLRFGVGVPEALNHTDPVLYPNEHPLSVSNGMYWTWATMYRFVIFEGRFDSVPTGVGVPPFLFSIHTGQDTCYRGVELSTQFTIPPYAVTELRLEVDLSRFFFDDTDTLDLSENNQAHGEIDQLDVALLLSDLVQGSFTLEGAP